MNSAMRRTDRIAGQVVSQAITRVLGSIAAGVLILGSLLSSPTATSQLPFRPLTHVEKTSSNVSAYAPLGESEGFGGGNPGERCRTCSVQSALGSQLGGQSMQSGQDVDPLTGSYHTGNSLFSIPSVTVDMGLDLTYDSERAEYEQANNSSAWQGFGYGWSSSFSPSLSIDPTTHNVTVNESNGATITFTPYNAAPIAGTSADSGPGAAENQTTGDVTLAAIGPSNSLYIYWFTAANGLWNGPLQIGGTNSTYSPPSVSIGSSGLPTVVAEGPGNALYVYWEDANAVWHGPLGIGGGGSTLDAPSISDSPTSGLPVVAAEGPSNTLYVYWEASNSQWYGPLGIGGGGSTYSAPSVTTSATSGLPTVTVEGPSNALYVYWEASNAQWYGPLGVGGTGTTLSAPSVADGPTSGLPNIAAEGPSNELYFYWEDASANWHGPLQIGGATTTYSVPAVDFNGSNLPSVLAEGPSNTLYSYWEDANSVWHGPYGVSPAGSTYSAPAAVGNNTTDSMDAYVLGPGNMLYHAGYTVANNNWYGDCPSGDGIWPQYTGASSTAQYCAPARADAQLTLLSSGSYQFITNEGQLELTFASNGVLQEIGNVEKVNGIQATQNISPGSSGCPSGGGVTGCTSWTDGTGRAVMVAYSGSLITQVIDPAGRDFGFAYTDGHNNLDQITQSNPSNPNWHYTYSYNTGNSSATFQHELLSETNPDGYATSLTYTGAGNVYQKTDGLGANTTTYSYTIDGCYNETNANNVSSSPCTGSFNGNTNQATYNTQQTTVYYPTYPNGEQDIDAYYGGLPTSLTSGAVTNGGSNSYWQGNHIWTLTYGYTSNHQPSTESVQLGSSPPSAFTFDANENVLTVTDPPRPGQQQGDTTTNFWNDSGASIYDQLCWTAPPGVTIPSGASCSTPIAGSTSYTYDSAGNVLTETDPAGNTTSYGIDETLDRACFVSPPGVSGSGTCSSPPTGSTLYTYDSQGDVQYLQPNYGTSGETTEEALYNVDGVPTSIWPADAFAMGTTPGSPNNAYETSNVADPTTELIDTTTAPLSRTTSYTYDLAGNTIVTQDPTGYTSTQYDADGRACWTHRAATAPTLPLASCASPPSGMTTITTYLTDTSAPLTTKTANGNTTTYHYGDAEFPTSATEVDDPMGTNIQYSAYDAFGRACVAGPANPFTSGYNSCSAATAGDTYSKMDQLGRVSTSEDQSGNTTTYSYGDPAYDTQATQAVSPLGTTTTAYDTDGRTISLTQPSGSVISTGYDARSRKCWTAPFASSASCTSPPTGTGVSTFSYNAAQQMSQMIDNNGNVTVPLQATTSYFYDNQGTLTSQTNDNGSTVGYAYNAALDLTCIAYPVHAGPNCQNAPSSTNSVVDRTIDPTTGRLTATTDWLGNTTNYGYSTDGANRLTSITYPSATGEQASYGYDLDGNLTSNGYTGPAVGTQSQTWTPNADDLEGSTSQLGPYSSSYGYTSYNRLTTGTTPGYAAGDAFTYNANGELATDAKPGNSTTTYSYNSADQLTGANASIGTVGHNSASAASPATSLTLNLPSGIEPGDQIVVSVGLPSTDAVNTPSGYTQLATVNAQVAVFDRTATGGESSVTFTFTKNKSGMTATVIVYRGVANVSPVDASSQAYATGTSLALPSVTATLSGDQLVAISEADGTSGSNNFTAPSGMTSEVTAGTSSTQMQIADKHLSSSGATGSQTSTYPVSAPLAGMLVALRPATSSYGYDANGNRTSATYPSGTTNYGYDTFNRLTSAGSASYAYDGTGLRMTENTGSSNLSFTWDNVSGGGTPLIIDDGTNAYIYGPLLFGGTAPVEQIKLSTSQETYLSSTPDGVQLAFNQSGSLVNRASYSPYGAQYNTASSSPTPFGFQGSYTDLTGLVYLVNRYYDPATAQFMSVDPKVAETAELYQFASDDPVNLTDPSGEDASDVARAICVLLCWASLGFKGPKPPDYPDAIQHYGKQVVLPKVERGAGRIGTRYIHVLRWTYRTVTRYLAPVGHGRVGRTVVVVVAVASVALVAIGGLAAAF